MRPAVRDTLPPADVTPIRRPARAPNLNAYTERFVRTIKESCLERMVLIGEGSLRRFLPPPPVGVLPGAGRRVAVVLLSREAVTRRASQPLEPFSEVPALRLEFR